MTSDDALRQAAQAAFATRLSAPVASLVDDVLSKDDSVSVRRLTFSAPEGTLTVSLQLAAAGVESIRVDVPSAAGGVELWSPDGRVAVLHQDSGGWFAQVDVRGPARVLCMGLGESALAVVLQTEWFSLP